MQRESQASEIPQHRRIGKQIVLPWSKAIEISFKGMQTRFWRSIITMSSVVLAIAFLMSIWTSAAIVNSLRTVPRDQARQAESQAREVQQMLSSGDGLTASELSRLVPLALAHTKEDITRLNAQISEIRHVAEAQRTADQTKELAVCQAASDQATKRLEVLKAAAGGSLNDATATAQAISETMDSRAARLRNRAENIRQMLFKEGIEVEEESSASTGPAQPAAHSVFGFLVQMEPKDLWLVFLALLVCFVGIVNAMLMSVSERFREIGTMKCLGALDSFIVKLFLLESSFQGLTGTLIGIVIGFLLSLLRASLKYHGYTYQYFPGTDILISVGLSVLAGVVLSVLAAVYPARTAARMEPVEAMRVEE